MLSDAIETASKALQRLNEFVVLGDGNWLEEQHPLRHMPFDDGNYVDVCPTCDTPSPCPAREHWGLLVSLGSSTLVLLNHVVQSEHRQLAAKYRRFPWLRRRASGDPS